MTVHSTTLLVCILPSLLFALAWMLRTDRVMRRQGGVQRGLLLLIGGAVTGAFVGLLFSSQDWVPRASLLDCVLVGI
ncbi:MAG TPA: hypothetical protein VMX12_08835, partial [Acidimicrobiia bacterium]|nr:hypothetical protein [Acidimicrobiia bacterium]